MKILVGLICEKRHYKNMFIFLMSKTKQVVMTCEKHFL